MQFDPAYKLALWLIFSGEVAFLLKYDFASDNVRRWDMVSQLAVINRAMV